MEDLKLYFDLQRFAEGDDSGAGGDVDTDTGDDGVEDSEAIDSDAIAIPGKLGLKDGQLQYVEDEDGDEGDDFGKDDEADGDAQAGNQPSEETATEPEDVKPHYYTAQELAKLSPAEIDVSRVPPEVLPFFAALVAKQQPAKEEKPLEARVELKDIPRDELEKQIMAIAKNTLAQELAAEGSTFNPDAQDLDLYDSANMKQYQDYHMRLARIVAKVERQTERLIEGQKQNASAKNAVYTQIETRAKDLEKQYGADFAGIDALTATHLHTMPYQKAAPIAVAIERLNNGQATETDIPVIEGYFEECRREYFAKKTGVTREAKKVPPQTLKPGNDKEEKARFNAKELGGMDQDGRIEYYKRTGLADRIANLG